MPSIALSHRLRTATQAVHRQAESAPLMRALFTGRIGADGYAFTLRQWHALYSALEEAQDRSTNDPVVGGFVDPTLYRRLALEQDLAWFTPDDRHALDPVLPATSAYASRLQDLARRDPAMILAHHYVRYLGDLSGGQFLGRAISRTFGLTDGRGAAFYDFPGIDAETYKASYRQRLDRLMLSEATVRALTEEANLAFELNRAVFDEVATHLGLESDPTPAIHGAESSASAA